MICTSSRPERRRAEKAKRTIFEDGAQAASIRHRAKRTVKRIDAKRKADAATAAR